jgi:hypothetical protein
LNITDEGRTLHKFLTTRGREGRRFATRFWERESTIGREREMLILVCKKWHVAKRFLNAAEQVTGIRGYAYLFDEQDTAMPDMGGIEKTLEKRARHRRAVMRLLFERSFTDRLMICVDPANLELLEDFYSDRCTTRLLELACDFDDDYLRGHAVRTGLAGPTSSEETIRRIVPTIRMDFAYESNAVRDRNYPNFYSISDRNDPEDNTMQISSFLDITEERARAIAHTPFLFAD